MPFTTIPCFNYRMDGIQGAVLEVKLRRLKEWAAARQNIALQYDRLFADKALSNVIRLPQACPDGDHVYHQYAIRVPRRDHVRARLKARGVAAGVHYPRPVHLQPGISVSARADFRLLKRSPKPRCRCRSIRSSAWPPRKRSSMQSPRSFWSTTDPSQRLARMHDDASRWI